MVVSEAAVQEFLWRSCPIYHHIGLVIESMRDGIYRCRVPLTPQNGNHLNTVHAAIQWAAAELPGGLVVAAIFDPGQLTKTNFVAVRSVSIEFLRPARTAITAEAVLGMQEAMEIKRLVTEGESAAFRLHTVVRNDSGETVATADAEYVIRPQRADQRSAQAGGPASQESAD